MKKALLILWVYILGGLHSCTEHKDATQSTLDSQSQITITKRYESGAKRWTEVTDPLTGEQQFIRYYESGVVKVIAPAKEHEEHGLSYGFHESGDTASKLNFKEGKLDGMQRWYDDKGCLIDIAIYKQGLPTERILFWDNQVEAEFIQYEIGGSIHYHAFLDSYGSFVQDTGNAMYAPRFYHGNIELSDDSTILAGDTVMVDAAVMKQDLRNVRGKLLLTVLNLDNNNIKAETISIPDNYLAIEHFIVLKDTGKFRLSLLYEREKISTGEKRFYESHSQTVLVK